MRVLWSSGLVDRLSLCKYYSSVWVHLQMLPFQSSFSAAKYVPYIKGCATSIKFSLKVRGINIIMFALKLTEFCSC